MLTTRIRGSATLVVVATVLWSKSARAEHWFCAMPNKLDSSRTVIFDFEVAGDWLVEKSPAEVSYHIVRNDDRAIVGVWVPSYMPKIGANLAIIDKQQGLSGENVMDVSEMRFTGNGWTPDSAMLWLRNYCSQNPLAAFVEAARELREQLAKQEGYPPNNGAQ